MIESEVLMKSVAYVEIEHVLSIPQTIAGKTPLVKSNLHDG